jgi:hypothetical protein
MRMDVNVYFMRDAGLSARRNLNDFPSIGRLAEAKKLALRRRVWFKVLNRVERGIIDLTVRYVICIKSGKLAKLVTAIVEKLQFAAENIVEKLTRTVGLPLARKISEIAISWGNHLAFTWADDHSFAKYLMVNYAKL